MNGIVCCECDRVLAELCGTSLKTVFSSVEVDLRRLKREVHSGSRVLEMGDLIRPFERLIVGQRATDVVTGIAIGSVQRFIDEEIITGTAIGERVCEMLVSCSFQTTSGYDCAFVFHNILSCMKSLCDKEMCSERALAKLFDHVLDELRVSEQTQRFELVDAMSILIKCVFRQKDEGIKNKCILDLFYFADAHVKGQSTTENVGVRGLIQIARHVDSGSYEFENLLISACILVYRHLTYGDVTRDSFVLALRLYFDVFSRAFLNYVIPFAQSFEFLLDFVLNPLKPVIWKQCVVRVIEDFLSLDHFVFSVYSNLNDRPIFPGVFGKLLKVAFSPDLSFGLEIPKLLIGPIEHATHLSLDEEKERHEKMTDFAAKFNEKPSQFTQNEYSPAEMAKLLMTVPGLSRQSIGDFFGRNKEFCIETLDAFLSLFDFSKLDFDSAIRTFLASFHIAGEGQIIDRIFGLFAKYYYKSHSDSDKFSSAESVHVLAYGWLMLHTAIYNNNVAKKPTLDDFNRMLARQNDGKDFDPRMMESLYKSIKRSQIPVQDDLQITTVGWWRLMIQKQSVIQPAMIREVSDGGDDIELNLFQTVWQSGCDLIFGKPIDENDETFYDFLNQCLLMAEKHKISEVADRIVTEFSKLALEDLAENRVTQYLTFLASTVKHYGSLVRDAWSGYIEFLISAYQLDLVPDESILFVDFGDNGKKAVLRQHLLSRRMRRNSTSMFLRFRMKRSSSEESPRISVQSELRECIVKTEFHQLASFVVGFGNEAVDALVNGISECSKSRELDADVNALYIAYCALLVEKVCESVRRVPPSVYDYYSRLLNKDSPNFVQSIVVNFVFMLLDAIPDFDVLDILGDMDQKLIQDHYELIEAGLASLVERHLGEFVERWRYKSIMRLLSCGLVSEREQSRGLFEKIINAIHLSENTHPEFHEFWFPVVQMEVSLLISKPTPNLTEHQIRLQTMLLSSDLTEQNWREVFNSVFFPVLAYLTTRKDRGITAVVLVKTVMNTFLFALPKLVKSPLFESIWFRLLSLALELSKAEPEHSEEVAAVFSNTLNVMKSSGAFMNARQKMWQLTKSSIDAVFPGMITDII